MSKYSDISDQNVGHIPNQAATGKLVMLLKEVRELAQSRCTCRFGNDREPMPVCWRCRIKNALDNYQEAASAPIPLHERHRATGT